MTSIQAGTRIADRYRIESLLASGGMGAVYRATDERLSRAVAIKILLAEIAADATQVARFEREAIASARLSHPGIIQVHDFGKTDAGVAYLVMELISGQTLSSVLDRSRLTPKRAVDIVDQALAALAAAHGAGIIHRDLKPANLMLVPLGGEREHVKILDFGIAQLKSGEAYARLTATGDVVGTPSFMSPEQARGEPCDPRADLYSMGMVLWCCLTGQRPWNYPHVAQIIVAVQSEMPRRADRVTADVPKAVATVVEKAIAKRAQDRFASAAEFAAELRKAANAIAPGTRAPVPQTAASPLGARLSPADLGRAALPVAAAASPPAPTAPPATPSPAPTAPATPIALAPRAITAAPLAAPATPTPTAPPEREPRPKRRWWLRITLALVALVALGGVATLALVAVLGVMGLSWFASLPNARHPAPGFGVQPAALAPDPTCAAAARCCALGGGDSSECTSYLSEPLDLDRCRQAIGSYGDAITAEGEDATPCSPTYAGP